MALPEFQNEPLTDFSSEHARAAMQEAIALIERDLGRELPLIIGAERTTVGATFTSLNPSLKTQTVAVCQKAGEREVNRAVEVADQAFQTWSRVPAEERAAVLLRAAEMLRRLGFQGRLTMIDGDDDAPYDRPPLSKSFLAGKSDSAALRPSGFYEEHGIELVRATVSAVDVNDRRVRCTDDSSFAYDALLLATGSEPRALDIPGHGLPHVHTLRSLSDSRAIIALAERSHRAAIMGASFIGLEVAAALRARDLAVSVVSPGPKPLAKVFGPELGAMIQTLHEEHGVHFHLGQTAARIENEVVVLQNGERLPADMVVAGIGVRPRLDLAKAAGLTLDRGVAVNERLETSVPGIYAAGDIARWPDPHTGEQIRVEHWVVAQRQGQVAARNMLGARERFAAAPFFWSQHYTLSIRYTGHAETWDHIDVDGHIADRACSVAFRRHGKTLAVASVKRDLENLEAEVALEADDEAALHQIVASS